MFGTEGYARVGERRGKWEVPLNSEAVRWRGLIAVLCCAGME